MTVAGTIVTRPTSHRWPIVRVERDEWAQLGASIGDSIVITCGRDVIAGEVVAVGVVRMYFCELADGVRVRVRRAGGRR